MAQEVKSIVPQCAAIGAENEVSKLMNIHHTSIATLLKQCLTRAAPRMHDELWLALLIGASRLLHPNHWHQLRLFVHQLYLARYLLLGPLTSSDLEAEQTPRPVFQTQNLVYAFSRPSYSPNATYRT